MITNLPELPEVETVVRGIAPFMEGKAIRQISVFPTKLRNPIQPFFTSAVENAKVLSVKRRGKYILICLNNNLTWITHLGMSGYVKIIDSDYYKKVKHDHVVWQVENKTIVLNDARRFGDIFITENPNDYGSLKSMGPEPFEITVNQFYENLQKTSRPIKNALLDQKIIAGLGNIYVAESLWLTGISPTKISNSIKISDAKKLMENIIIVLNKAIYAGGTTLKDHRQTNGELGYFQQSLMVYNQENKPCQKNQCDGIIYRIIQSGRSTFFCPKCQQ